MQLSGGNKELLPGCLLDEQTCVLQWQDGKTSTQLQQSMQSKWSIWQVHCCTLIRLTTAAYGIAGSY